jgi:hypothetical protein
MISERFKFRAWVKKDRAMYPIISIFPAKVGLSISDSGPFLYPCNELDIMHATGLHDSNNQLIYEGDILERFELTKCCKKPSNRMIGTVIWSEGGFYFKESDGMLYGFANVENEKVFVVGNIYQNPEGENND